MHMELVVKRMNNWTQVILKRKLLTNNPSKASQKRDLELTTLYEMKEKHTQVGEIRNTFTNTSGLLSPFQLIYICIPWTQISALQVSVLLFWGTEFEGEKVIFYPNANQLQQVRLL